MRPELEHQLYHLLLSEGELRPQVSPAAGRAEVHVRMQGMVHTIAKQIAIDYAELARVAQAELEKQVADIDLHGMVRDMVKDQLRLGMQGLTEEIRKRVQRTIADAVDTHMGSFADDVAKQIAARVFKVTATVEAK